MHQVIGNSISNESWYCHGGARHYGNISQPSVILFLISRCHMLHDTDMGRFVKICSLTSGQNAAFARLDTSI